MIKNETGLQLSHSHLLFFFFICLFAGFIFIWSRLNSQDHSEK